MTDAWATRRLEERFAKLRRPRSPAERVDILEDRIHAELPGRPAWAVRFDPNQPPPENAMNPKKPTKTPPKPIPPIRPGLPTPPKK